MLINQSHVRQYALAQAAQSKIRIVSDRRVPRFTRVSASFLEAVNAAAINAINSRIAQHGSKGQTLT